MSFLCRSYLRPRHRRYSSIQRRFFVWISRRLSCSSYVFAFTAVAFRVFNQIDRRLPRIWRWKSNLREWNLWGSGNWGPKKPVSVASKKCFKHDLFSLHSTDGIPTGRLALVSLQQGRLWIGQHVKSTLPSMSLVVILAGRGRAFQIVRAEEAFNINSHSLYIIAFTRGDTDTNPQEQFILALKNQQTQTINFSFRFVF